MNVNAWLFLLSTNRLYPRCFADVHDTSASFLDVRTSFWCVVDCYELLQAPSDHQIAKVICLAKLLIVHERHAANDVLKLRWHLLAIKSLLKNFQERRSQSDSKRSVLRSLTHLERSALEMNPCALTL